MGEHREIWLEPACCAEGGDDRHWCQDDAWGPCEECGTKPVKYILASEHEAMVAALENIKQLSDCKLSRQMAADALASVGDAPKP